MLKIGLLGFTLENANKGCEALTYSFIFMLKKYFGTDISIRYYSTAELYGSIREYFPDIEFSYYQLSKKNVLTGLLKDFNKCDLIFDISFGDGFSDIYNPYDEFFNAVIKQIATFSKTPFILLPQTYGPFKNRILEKQAAHIIRKTNVVFSRDGLSSEYVENIANIKPVTVTDLAFSLPYEKNNNNRSEKIKIGINVSGLLWKGGFLSSNQFGLSVDYQEYIRALIENYYHDERYEVHLIPHVIETVPESRDGDVYVNELLKKEYPSIITAPAFSDPVKTKNYIAGMDVVTAARMHATVDAFSSFVPVIPFAYSRKFEGLYKVLGYKFIVDGQSCTTHQAIQQTIEWINAYKEIACDVITGMKTVEKHTAEFETILKEFITKHK